MIIQILWAKKVDWDEELKDDISHSWSLFRSELIAFQNFKIPRLVSLHETTAKYCFHVFCDASKQAYAAAVYVVSIVDNKIACNLLCSKTKVAPLKIITIPRLELCGAYLAAKLMYRLLGTVNVPVQTINFWCDSQVTLHWLSTPPRDLKVFVANRVSEVQELLAKVDHRWNYVRSKDNPADINTRGCSLLNLKDNSLWWNGPRWLLDSPSKWPRYDFSVKNDAGSFEFKKPVTSTFVSTNDVSIFDKFSSFSTLMRVIAYCHVYMTRLRKKTSNSFNLEYQKALLSLIRIHQRKHFYNDIDKLLNNQNVSKNSKLRSLNPFLDKDNLLRVGGRLSNANLSYDQCHPFIINDVCKFTVLLVKYYHIKYQHANVLLLRNILQQRFWIIRGKGVIKKCVRECMICVRFKAKTYSQLMGDLPADRVNPSRPFSKCGVDYAGPFLLKKFKGRCSTFSKAYISLFICFTTRAIHLEVVSELSRDAFLAALKRFISRRGKPQDIYSDNGRNFVGARSYFDDIRKFMQSEEVKNDIIKFASSEFINWHMIPAYTPHTLKKITVIFQRKMSLI